MSGLNWAQLIAGAVVGLIVAVLLVDPIKAIRDRTFYRVRRNLNRLVRRLSKRAPPSELFRFGSFETTWMVLDGDGQESYAEVSCTHVEPPLVLPDHLAELKRSIAAEQADRLTRGEHAFWNGETLALDAYFPSRIGEREKPALRLRFRSTDYFSFLATSLSLDRVLSDGKTVKEKYLSDPDWTKPSTSLSTSFGINVALITSDHKLVAIRRGQSVGSMPGAFGTSINEALNVADMSPSGIDVQACGHRGAMEELGFDLPRRDISFLSLGVDTALAQWGLLGIARTTSNYDDIVEARSNGAKDKFEADRMYPVDFTTEGVVQFVRENPVWAPGGLVCIYHALVNEHGRADVDRVLRQMKKEKPPSR